MSDELLEVKPEFQGFHNTGYPGAFPPAVEERIKKIVGSPCLHLFSGRSKIGEVRIDFARPEATKNMDVFEFIDTEEAKKIWAFVLLDPPYSLSEANTQKMGYAKHDAFNFTNSVPRRQKFESFLKAYVDNVIWFDVCSPCPRGFQRERTWLYLTGGYHTVRVLTWLKRKGERLT